VRANAERGAARRAVPRATAPRARRGFGDAAAGLLGLGRDRLGQRAQLGAQAVDLVDQREHQRRGLLVEVEVGGEFAEQAQPREVGLAEGRAPVAQLGADAAGGGEAAQAGDGQAVDAGDDLGLAVGDGHDGIPFRGS
jgi:hypothetical protein